MNLCRTGWSTLARIALLALLLAAQGAVLAHGVDHLDVSGDNLCAVCSASHVQGAATLDTGTVAATPTASDIKTASPQSGPVSSWTDRPHARAPPSTL
ncbi:hypothetical protein [Elongatibacter sediminis]|uniref:Cytochrome c domain-containing protein n=1 Tax=Elongatibacter sediminis TaxID=3119006 RepID=A0AAW9RNX7_9GAMM